MSDRRVRGANTAAVHRNQHFTLEFGTLTVYNLPTFNLIALDFLSFSAN